MKKYRALSVIRLFILLQANKTYLEECIVLENPTRRVLKRIKKIEKAMKEKGGLFNETN